MEGCQVWAGKNGNDSSQHILNLFEGDMRVTDVTVDTHYMRVASAETKHHSADVEIGTLLPGALTFNSLETAEATQLLDFETPGFLIEVGDDFIQNEENGQVVSVETVPSPLAAENIKQSDEEPSRKPIPVFFDLETTGIHAHAEICEIAAKCGSSSFQIYSIPVHGIATGASAVNGLTCTDGKLFLHGKQVNAVEHRTAISHFISYLRELQLPVVLVAHNAIVFDAPMILRAVTREGMDHEFLNIVQGFTDTLPLFRKIWPGQKSYRQPVLAQELIGKNSAQHAHQATADVQVLEALTQRAGITPDMLLTASVPTLHVKKQMASSNKITGQNFKRDSHPVPVIFDLETTGLDADAEICEIAAKYGAKHFQVYSIPVQGVSPGASAINGLTCFDGKLFLCGQQVDGVEHRVALTRFVTFLRELETPVVLVAHNAVNFDAPMVLRAVAKEGLDREFAGVVDGFADTLPLFRKVWPGRQSYRQEVLVQQILGKHQSHYTHQASVDVHMLELLLEKARIDAHSLVNAKVSISFIQKKCRIIKKVATQNQFNTMTEVSPAMRKRMISAGIQMSQLIHVFSNSGAEGVIFMLSEETQNGKPRVTKCKKVLDTIISHLQKL